MNVETKEMFKEIQDLGRRIEDKLDTINNGLSEHNSKINVLETKHGTHEEKIKKNIEDIDNMKEQLQKIIKWIEGKKAQFVILVSLSLIIGWGASTLAEFFGG